MDQEPDLAEQRDAGQRVGLLGAPGVEHDAGVRGDRHGVAEGPVQEDVAGEAVVQALLALVVHAALGLDVEAVADAQVLGLAQVGAAVEELGLDVEEVVRHATGDPGRVVGRRGAAEPAEHADTVVELLRDDAAGLDAVVPPDGRRAPRAEDRAVVVEAHEGGRALPVVPREGQQDHARRDLELVEEAEVDEAVLGERVAEAAVPTHVRVVGLEEEVDPLVDLAGQDDPGPAEVELLPEAVVVRGPGAAVALLGQAELHLRLDQEADLDRGIVCLVRGLDGRGGADEGHTEHRHERKELLHLHPPSE